MVNRINHRDAGFSLVELLVVIIVIGILAGIAIPLLYNQRSKASGANAVSDLRNAATAEETQFTDSGSYASTLSPLVAAGFRQSPGVTLGVAASPMGYCEVAHNGATYWWFDSSAGGVQHATTTALTPPASANGVCAASVPSQLS